MRTFIAIDIPGEIKEKIAEIQKELPEFKGNFTEEENLHLTLKFLGEISKEQLQEIEKNLKKIRFRGFEAKIDSIGFFDNSRSKDYNSQIIVWLHVKNCDELQKKVDEALSAMFEKEIRFMSHLTIARAKKVKDKKKFLEQIQKIKIPEMNFFVDKFKIKKPAYKDLEIYNLEI